MKHLTQLKKVNGAFALLNATIGLVCAGGLGWLAAIGFQAGDPIMGWSMLGTGIFTVVVIAVFVWLYLATGKKVEQGRWRIVQTVLALLCLSSNPPVGTLYGAYALWVCWVHPPTKARFELPDAVMASNVEESGSNRFYKATMWVIYGFGALLVALTLATFIGVGYLMSIGGEEPDVVVTAEQIEITGMYGETIDRDDVLEVDLRDELPTITVRTNGYAMGGDLKGWFATEELDKVKLFVHTDVSPYVYIHTTETWVIIGYDDADRTRELYDQLGGVSTVL